jgi:hypothetical protein
MAAVRTCVVGATLLAKYPEILCGNRPPKNKVSKVKVSRYTP